MSSQPLVFILKGYPYQVRNHKSYIKVVMDFVSPKNVQQCVHLTKEFHLPPKSHRPKLKSWKWIQITHDVTLDTNYHTTTEPYHSYEAILWKNLWLQETANAKKIFCILSFYILCGILMLACALTHKIRMMLLNEIIERGMS